MKSVKAMLLNKPSYELSNKEQNIEIQSKKKEEKSER